MRNEVAPLVLSVVIAAAGCSKQETERPARQGQTTREARPAPEPVSRPAPAGPRPGEPAAHRHDPGDPRQAARPGDARLPPDGHLGARFTVKTATALAKVMADPGKFAGKKIRVAGEIVAFCHHRRAWYAVGEKGKRPWLRVISAPAFFVPPGAKGMTAETEGTLAFRDVSERMAKHLAQGHGLFGANPDNVKGPQKMPVLQASGAKFTRPEK